MLRTQVLADCLLPPIEIEVPITGELPPRKYILDTGPVRAAVEKLGRQFECLARACATRVCCTGCIAVGSQRRRLRS